MLYEYNFISFLLPSQIDLSKYEIINKKYNKKEILRIKKIGCKKVIYIHILTYDHGILHFESNKYYQTFIVPIFFRFLYSTLKMGFGGLYISFSTLNTEF